MGWILNNAPERLLVTLSVPNLDASLSNRFRNEIAPLLAGDIPIVIDFTLIKFVDSSGIGALCSLVEKTTPAYLRFTGVSERVSKALSRIPLLSPFWMPRPMLAVCTA